MAERVFTREDAKGLIRTNTDKFKIPSDFTAIERGALAGFSQMEELIIPEGVTRISSHAFYTRSFKNTCKMKRLTIPSTLTKFGRWAFYGCDELESVYLPDGFSPQQAIELFWPFSSTMLFFGKKTLFGAKSKNKTVQDYLSEATGVLTLGSASLLEVAADSSLLIPASYTIITSTAMRGLTSKGIKRLLIPRSVHGIAANAFSSLDTLEQVIFEEGTEYIDNCALAGCKRLRSIIIPDSVTEIGVGAFSNLPSLESIRLPAHLRDIPDELFSGDKALKTILFGNSIERVGAGAFADCISLRSLMLPQGVQTIGNSAFWNCKLLQRVYVPVSCKSVTQSTFGNCPFLAELHMPRIIHDQYEMKRIFGDITNPTITWLDPGAVPPQWNDDDILPEVKLAEIPTEAPICIRNTGLPTHISSARTSCASILFTGLLCLWRWASLFRSRFTVIRGCCSVRIR